MDLQTNMVRVNPPRSRDYLAAVLGGVLFAASFPPSPLAWLAWFALVPHLRLLEDRQWRAALALGWVWGMAHFVALIYWVVIAVGHYGKMSVLTSLLPMGLLAGYLAIYPAMFSLLVALLGKSKLAPLYVPCSWVALEYARAKLLTGFPWCLAGYSQYAHPLLIQVASLCGVYGVSFLIILVNWYLHELFISSDTPFAPRVILLSLFTFLCIGSTLWYGYQRTHGKAEANSQPATPMRIAIVQPSIDQSVKWDPHFQERTMKLYNALTRSASRSNPDLVIWPETATPFFFQANKPMAKKIYELSQELECPILFGSPAYEESAEGIRYFNRAYLLLPDGGAPQYYDKVHLVPFGEYVPLGRLLSFVGKLVPGAGSFSPGSTKKTLTLCKIKLGVLICFEAIFPELSREEKSQGASLFVNLTNDAWFGTSSAPYQHLAMSAFRAVENGVPLVRAANTGFSAIIDKYGKIRQKTPLFRQKVLIGQIKVASNPKDTFYTIHGDLFAQVAILICCLGLVVFVAHKTAIPSKIPILPNK